MRSEKELVQAFREQFERVERTEKELDEAKQEMEKTKQALLDLFEAEGKERTATYAGIGFITRTKPRLYANCNEENKPELFAILRQEGRADLIKEIVHPSSLSSYVGELLDSGKPIPGCIGYILKPAVRLYTKE